MDEPMKTPGEDDKPPVDTPVLTAPLGPNNPGATPVPEKSKPEPGKKD